MPLLSTSREVEYADSIQGKAFRSVPFWVAGSKAYAIPGFERPIKGHSRWNPFDHGGDRLRRMFNYGPVGAAEIVALVLPGAPPFFIHTLYSAVTRVKFGTATGYGESVSYYLGYGGIYHRHPCWVLSHNPDMVANLPEPYRSWFTRALASCDTWT